MFNILVLGIQHNIKLSFNRNFGVMEEGEKVRKFMKGLSLIRQGE